jgi:1-acyl-sn-glycerol-3-phosphate acyltransferase
MSNAPSLNASQLLLDLAGTDLSVSYQNRLPSPDVPVLVVSNHRSFMDAFILMKALDHPLRVVCHHYMGKTPILKDIVHFLGCYPLESPNKRQKSFLQEAANILNSCQWLGIFPEGATPMLQLTQPHQVGEFQRGFAHLALGKNLPNLAVLPVAIASYNETIVKPFPIRFLHLLDADEPLFDQDGFHEVVLYHHVKVLIGQPYWVDDSLRQQYQGKRAKSVVNQLTRHCHQEIVNLLQPVW